MTTITPTTVEELLDYWPENIPYKGKLVSDDGDMCAQAEALYFLDNYSLSDLRNIDQAIVNTRVAEIFGISRSHSVLLRIINDRQDGAPSSVIRNPEQLLGNQTQVVLALWRHLDRMTAADWGKSRLVAFDELVAARKAALEASQEVAGRDARLAAFDAAWNGTLFAPRVAAWASSEIQGAAVMRAKNQPFFFLPLLGFSNPEAVIAADSN